MRSRLRPYVLLVALACGPGLADGRLSADEKAEAPAKAPRISVEPAFFDFGKALPSRTLEKQFSIRNFGDADLVVEQITTTCGCTAALLSDDQKVIKPGASGQLRVRLETRDYSGRVVRSVLVRSNDPAKNVLEVKVEATVQASAK